MYETKTYEDILQQMLDRVPEGMDKREGSIIYDALAPAAAGLAILYIELDVILNQTFADTATGEYLEKRCAERGLTRKEAKARLEKYGKNELPQKKKESVIINLTTYLG